MTGRGKKPAFLRKTFVFLVGVIISTSIAYGAVGMNPPVIDAVHQWQNAWKQPSLRYYSGIGVKVTLFDDSEEWASQHIDDIYYDFDNIDDAFTGRLFITRILPNSTAGLAGIQQYFEVISINGYKILRMSKGTRVSRVTHILGTGVPNSKVRLELHELDNYGEFVDKHNFLLLRQPVDRLDWKRYDDDPTELVQRGLNWAVNGMHLDQNSYVHEHEGGAFYYEYSFANLSHDETFKLELDLLNSQLNHCGISLGDVPIPPRQQLYVSFISEWFPTPVVKSANVISPGSVLEWDIFEANIKMNLWFPVFGNYKATKCKVEFRPIRNANFSEI